MLKLIARITLVTLLFLVTFSCSSLIDAAFRPVTVAGDQYVFEPPIDDPEFISNLEFVLSFYREPYRTTSDGTLVISRRLAADMDLLYNYTQKAHDEEWLAQQRDDHDADSQGGAIQPWQALSSSSRRSKKSF